MRWQRPFNPYDRPDGHYQECACHEDSTGLWCVECHQTVRVGETVCPHCKLTADECESATVAETAKCVCEEIDLAGYEEAQEQAYEARREAAMWGD